MMMTRRENYLGKTKLADPNQSDRINIYLKKN